MRISHGVPLRPAAFDQRDAVPRGQPRVQRARAAALCLGKPERFVVCGVDVRELAHKVHLLAGAALE